MDPRTGHKKKLTIKHAKLLRGFTDKILEMTHSERLQYFKNINEGELKFIEEIVLNFLNNNIKAPPETFSEMKKIKSFLRSFVKTKGRFKYKKTLLSSLKGLSMVAYILPLVNLIVQNV